MVTRMQCAMVAAALRTLQMSSIVDDLRTFRDLYPDEFARVFDAAIALDQLDGAT